MCRSASGKESLSRTLLAVAVPALLLSGLVPHAVRAAQPIERLTAEQRKELEQRATDLSHAGYQLYGRGDVASALEKSKQLLQIREQLYPKSEYPDGHHMVALGVLRVGELLEVQGAYRDAQGYYERALAMFEALFPKERDPQGHPILAQILNDLGVVLHAQGAFGEGGAITSGHWRCARRSTPRSGIHRGTPTWPKA